MSCPDVGVWRAWLDGELSGEPAALAEHLATCPSCNETVDELRANAALAATAIGALAPSLVPAAPAAGPFSRRDSAGRSAEVAALGPRVHATLAAEEAPDMAQTIPYEEQRRMSRMPRRWRLMVAGLAAALALTFLVGTPDGRTAAAQFLAQFRSQRFVAVSFDPARRSALADLDRLGTIQGERRGRPLQDVASVAEAAQRVGFPIKLPDPATLPAGVSQTPKVSVQAASDFRFTFDRDKAQSYFRASGHPEVNLPARFHGATLVVGLPAAVFLQYPRSTHEIGLVVAEAGELAVGVEGNVTLDELRELLLGLPDLPPETAQQLRAIQDWRNTLPIPVPMDRIRWQQVTVAGGPGLLLADNSGLGSGAIWQRDGRVYGVAGAAPAAVIQRVAENLR